MNAADKLFTEMHADGVQNIVYMNFFYIQEAAKKPAFDWMQDQMEILAERHNCIIVDPMAYMNPDYIGPDNMHPNAQGSSMLAGLIWDAMRKNNIDPATGTTDGSSGNGGCGR